jgi:hypothetical protein
MISFISVHRIARTHGIFIVLVFAVLFFHRADAATTNVRPPPLPNLAILYDQLIAELHRGGTAVYVVPFETIGVDQMDQPEWWKNCVLSRMISARGLEQAAAVSRAIQQLELNISVVETSERCTDFSTWTYTLGNSRLLRHFETPDLNPIEVLRLSGHKDPVIALHAMGHLQSTQADSVKFLFGSPFPVSAAPHPVMSDLSPGDSAIFRASPDSEVILLAKLNWRQWAEMGNYYYQAKRANSPKPPRKLAASQSKK